MAGENWPAREASWRAAHFSARRSRGRKAPSGNRNCREEGLDKRSRGGEKMGGMTNERLMESGRPWLWGQDRVELRPCLNLWVIEIGSIRCRRTNGTGSPANGVRRMVSPGAPSESGVNTKSRPSARIARRYSRAGSETGSR